jgi:hypothetical protein
VLRPNPCTRKSRKTNRMAALERAPDYHSEALELTRAIPFPYAACPACGHDMVAISVAPAFLREGCEDINYTCKRCYAQIRRRVKSR